MFKMSILLIYFFQTGLGFGPIQAWIPSPRLEMDLGSGPCPRPFFTTHEKAVASVFVECPPSTLTFFSQPVTHTRLLLWATVREHWSSMEAAPPLASSQSRFFSSSFSSSSSPSSTPFILHRNFHRTNLKFKSRTLSIRCSGAADNGTLIFSLCRTDYAHFLWLLVNPFLVFQYRIDYVFVFHFFVLSRYSSWLRCRQCP